MKKFHIRSIEKKTRHLPGKQPKEPGPDDFVVAPNRRDRRRSGKKERERGVGEVDDILALGPNAGRKSGRGTGSVEWLRRAQYEREKRQALSKVETGRLSSAVGKVAQALQDAGYETVWDLVNVPELSKFTEQGFSESDMLRVRGYLEQQGLSVVWE